MVAYKKFSKAERKDVVRVMTKNIIDKEYKPIMANVESELTSLFMKDIPNEVFEFEKKYPHLIDKGDVTLYGYDFLTKEDKEKYDVWIRWNQTYPSFHVKNIYNKMIDGASIHGFHFSDVLVKYVKNNAPEIAEKIKTITIKRLDLQDWSDKLSCTLSSITTINKLKEEFPEAYGIYVSLYGEPGSSCKKVKDNKGNVTSMCDNIEKLRAEYNKVVDKTV